MCISLLLRFTYSNKLVLLIQQNTWTVLFFLKRNDCMNFAQALTTNDTVTENGMPTHSTSSEPLLDLFFKMGGARKDPKSLSPLFHSAYATDPSLTMKALFYNRDIRGGQGERDLFRMMFGWAMKSNPTVASRNWSLIPEYGRWDDAILIANDHEVLWVRFVELIREYYLDDRFGLPTDSSLLAKWLPREGKKYGRIAKRLMKDLGLNAREYRRWIAGLSSVPTVENLASSKRWTDVNYNHVPSIASKKYRKAFAKHDSVRYHNYLIDLANKIEGVKINASAIFPHDILRPLVRWHSTYSNSIEMDQINAQWDALPNYLPEGSSFLPVCDVSGSMSGDPMDVCVALGIYLSERNKGLFKDMFITFSAKPTLQTLMGKASDRVKQLKSADWDMNTDLEAMFELILNQAMKHKLPADQMPQGLLIISDMQFDQSVQTNQDAMQMIRTMYAQAGYNVPTVVFWNVRTSNGVPVKAHETGVALVSGYSPSIMKMVLQTKPDAFTPFQLMMNTLNSERYSPVE